MKIYTKTGDQGETSLIGGVRISKADLRINSYGEIDELNAYIGLLRGMPVNNDRRATLKEIQDRLFTIGSHLALAPEKESRRIPDLREEDIVLLEGAIDEMQEKLEPLKAFILPGGHPDVSFGHVARTVCRRAERAVVSLSRQEAVEPLIIQYLNRLSDYLFVLTRTMGRELNVEESHWFPRR